MTYAPAEPFAEEELIFIPLEGAFDAEAVTRFLLALPFTFQDPHDPKVFVTCEDAECAEEVRARRAANSDERLPLVMVVWVDPTQVTVTAWAGEAFYPAARRVAAWLMAQRPCRVVNEMGTDLTASVEASLRA